MQLADVWFRYRRRDGWVLRAVTVAARPGEVVAVAGGNGAGKSTLLTLAAGVLRPSRGAVRQRPRVVGWVPERFPANQPFTVHSYLSAVGAVRGLPATVVERSLRSWADRLDLTPFLRTRLPDLSKGTAQKVGLTQALLVQPDLLVLDEPWEGLDAATRDLVPEIVAETAANAALVLVSDHRGEIARLPASRRWTVADGQVSEAPVTGSTREDPDWLVEVAVPAGQAPATVAKLRADGHRVVRVRPGGTVRGTRSGAGGP